MDLKPLQEKAVEIVKKHTIACAKELALEVALEAAGQYIAETPSKIDDLIWAQAKEAARKAIEGL